MAMQTAATTHIEQSADETSAHNGTSEEINRYATAETAPGSAAN